MTTSRLRLGLISALDQEQTGLIESMSNISAVSRGMRDYVSGNLWGIDSVCVLSRLGKVAAAATAATLIERFDVTHIVFTPRWPVKFPHLWPPQIPPPIDRIAAL
jgi:adenosylhomocysteine nucleosidase